MHDFILIGGGIVGVSTALQLKQRHPGADNLLIERETSLALHQTGRNSGVVHAGVYYQPGSLKSEFCKQGAAFTVDFCLEHGLPFTRCGKLLVATDDLEYERMHALEQRCIENKIDTHRLSDKELKAREPNINGCTNTVRTSAWPTFHHTRPASGPRPLPSTASWCMIFFLPKASAPCMSAMHRPLPPRRPCP